MCFALDMLPDGNERDVEDAVPYNVKTNKTKSGAQMQIEVVEGVVRGRGTFEAHGALPLTRL